MRKYPWIIATLTSACCLVLVLNGFRAASVAPASAEVIQVANGNWGNDVGSPDAVARPPAVTLNSQNVRGVLGNAVRSATDEDMGRIVDIIVDRNGTPRAAVIDFGGFLGVGSRKIAIDWNAMRFTGLSRITLELTRDQVKAAPAYEAGSKTIVVLSASPEFARSRMTERTSEP
jgi:hypothetical protein